MRHPILSIGLALAAAGISAPRAAAQIAGPWRVTGDVSGHGFVLDCRFDPIGSQFGGICIEAGGNDGHVKLGKVHKLSDGAINGQNVHWTYPVSMMLMSFDIRFTGRMAGNAISGEVSAAGRKGMFSALRK